MPTAKILVTYATPARRIFARAAPALDRVSASDVVAAIRADEERYGFLLPLIESGGGAGARDDESAATGAGARKRARIAAAEEAGDGSGEGGVHAAVAAAASAARDEDDELADSLPQALRGSGSAGVSWSGGPLDDDDYDED